MAMCDYVPMSSTDMSSTDMSFTGMLFTDMSFTGMLFTDMSSTDMSSTDMSSADMSSAGMWYHRMQPHAGFCICLHSSQSSAHYCKCNCLRSIQIYHV